MAKDRVSIEGLLRKLEFGAKEDRFDALMGLSILSKSGIENNLVEKIRRHLTPIVTGNMEISLQEGCFAAIALAKLGDRSQDVSATLLAVLKYIAEDPEKFSGPMDKHLPSNSEAVFAVQIITALSLFKGGGDVVRHLIDVISRCNYPDNGEERIKSLAEPLGTQFYDVRIKNLVDNCLCCIGAIGDTENEDGRKMLQWWSSRGNPAAKAAEELSGSNWSAIRKRADELEKRKVAEPETESHEPTKPEPKLEEGKELQGKKEEPEKKGFFKRLFG